MSAYGVVISVKNTIDHILHCARLSLVPPSVEIIQVAYDELLPWEEILKRLDESRKSKSRNKVNALDARIKDTLWNFEDLLESLLSHQITLQSAEPERETDGISFSIDLQSLREDVDSFIHTLKDIREDYIYQVDNMPEDEDENEDEDEDGTKSKMIGLSDQFEQHKISILDQNSGAFDIIAIVGMAGVGKTRLARELYEDPEITSFFDCRLWITVGRKSSVRSINQFQVSHNILSELKDDDNRLIVLDDVWDHKEELYSLLCSIVGMRKKRILITARDGNVLSYVQNATVSPFHYNVVRFLNEEESKELLCHKVFGDNIICPPQPPPKLPRNVKVFLLP